MYSKPCAKNGYSQEDRKLVFKTNYQFNAGQKYCRMLQGKHSAILSTYIKLPFVIKIFVLPIFEWPFYTGFTVYNKPWCGASRPLCFQLNGKHNNVFGG